MRRQGNPVYIEKSIDQAYLYLYCLFFYFFMFFNIGTCLIGAVHFLNVKKNNL